MHRLAGAGALLAARSCPAATEQLFSIMAPASTPAMGAGSATWQQQQQQQPDVVPPLLGLQLQQKFPRLAPLPTYVRPQLALQQQPEPQQQLESQQQQQQQHDVQPAQPPTTTHADLVCSM